MIKTINIFDYIKGKVYQAFEDVASEQVINLLDEYSKNGISTITSRTSTGGYIIKRKGE